MTALVIHNECTEQKDYYYYPAIDAEDLILSYLSIKDEHEEQKIMRDFTEDEKNIWHNILEKIYDL